MTILAANGSDARPLRLRARWYTPCMGNLEKLPWIDAFAVTGYGVRVGVRVSDPELIPLLQRRRTPGVRLSPTSTVDRMLSVIKGGPGAQGSVRKFHLVYADHVLVGRSHDFDRVLDTYDTHLRLAIAQLSCQKLFVHAGVVAWQGKAILFPGKSLAGKTHLVAELVKAGATYFSDEYAVLDKHGMVHPFAKPLSLRPSPIAPQVETPVEAIGGFAAQKALPVGLIVMTQYKDRARWRPKCLTPGQGVLELLGNTFAARQSPQLAMDVLGRIASGALILKSQRGEATAITHSILRAVETRRIV